MTGRAADKVLLWMSLFVLLPCLLSQATTPGIFPDTDATTLPFENPTDLPPDKVTQEIHIPHHNKMLTLDIIQNAKVQVVFVEVPEHMPNLSVRLETPQTENQDQSGVRLSHTVTSLDDEINIKLSIFPIGSICGQNSRCLNSRSLNLSIPQETPPGYLPETDWKLTNGEVSGRCLGDRDTESSASEYLPVIVSVVCVVTVVVVAAAVNCYCRKHGTYRYRVREPAEFNTESDGQTPVRTHQPLRRVVPPHHKEVGDTTRLCGNSDHLGHDRLVWRHPPESEEEPVRMSEELGRISEEEDPAFSTISYEDQVNTPPTEVTATCPSSPLHALAEPKLQALWDDLPFIDDSDESVTLTPDAAKTTELRLPTCVTCSRSNHSLGPGLLPVYLLAILSVLAVIAVCTLSPSNQESVLTVAVPSSTLIRHVRMYSDRPSLSDFRVNSSSLSLVSRLQLLDFSSCDDSLTACITYAMCESAEGEVTCRCKRGYYVHALECRSCSTSCPEHHFMTSVCSASRDIVCQKCTVCNGSTYEAAPCTATQDTICVEVSFPVGILPMNYTQLHDDGTVINVTSSSNMFMERLRDMEELETPMYVTNNQQSMEYVWKRTSGLQIKIGISDVYLVPEYVDLDHTDDSPFFHMNRNISSTLKKKFQLTEAEYCRDPIPDFYSLYLHIYRHRITAAKTLKCETKRQSRNCPAGYKDGHTYLRRYINTPCHKHEINRHQNMSKLENTRNSVVCTDSTPLSLIFGMPNPAADAMRFPSEDCKFNQVECQECLDKDTCSKDDTANITECCNIHCYKMPTCNQAYSSSCPQADVECAQGEVYMFTLSPVFEQMDKRFMCHVKYKVPPILYKINYEVRVPSLNYHIEQRNFTISVTNLNSHRELSTNLDFLNVQHNTWFDFEEEMIAIANHADIIENKGNLSLHPLKKSHEFDSRPFDVRKDFGTHMFTYIQFDRPFRYSSITWMNDGCEKNLSWIYPNQTIYKTDSVPVTAKLFRQRGQIHYQMYRRHREPLIRLFVNKSQSVLSTFQAELADSVLIPASLQSSITWSPRQQIWSINITGSLAAVPGVMGFQVFDKMMTRCIGYFDVLVTNNPHFYVQFNVSSSQPRLPDIFVVLLNDSVTSHQVILSSMILPEEVTSSPAPVTRAQVSQRDRSTSIWLPVIIMVVFTFISVAVVFVVYVCIHLKARYSAEEMEKTESVLLNNVDTVKVPEKIYTPSTSRPASRTVVLAFILLYGAYSIVFTFSVAFGILYISHLSVLSNFTQVSNLTEKLHHEVRLSVDQLKSFESREISYLKKQFKQRKDACSHHLNRENSAVLSHQVSVLENQLQVIYVQNGSLQFLADNMARQSASKHIEKIQSFIEECNSTVHNHFKRLTQKYYSELEEVSKNGWLDFPREMFLRQKKEGYDSMSSSHLIKFMTWLQMDKADTLLSVDEIIDHSLSSLAPSIESLIATNINSIQPGNVPRIKVTNSTLQAYKYIVMQRSPGTSGETTATNKGRTTLSDSRNATRPVQIIDLKLNSMLYLLIALFLVVDIFLLVFRLAWLYTQVQEVKEGCEELIPQDEAARKVLKTKTGQNPPRHFDALDPSCPFTQNTNENINENELNVYFCQSYPRSKEDILRDIWAQKMSVKTKNSKEKLQDIWLVQDMLSCVCWLHRVLMSKLFWRVVCSSAVVLFVCCVMCVLDSWLCPENLLSLDGVDLLTTELQWQAERINHHVAAVADAMNSALRELKVSVDRDIEDTNSLLWSTWHEQMNILGSMLSVLCNNSGTDVCDLSFLNPSHHAPLSSCNFLPLQTTVYSELNIINIQNLVISELSPLVDLYRHLVFMTAYILIVLLCARVLCQVIARTVKDYLVVSGHFPRSRIYQFSNTMTGMSDDPNDPEKEIHRSASWLESCESGVYVGDNDDSARESTI